MHSFKNWLTEGTEKNTETPHHIYHTSDGHQIHVHIKRDELGSHAEYKNHSLGGMHVKTITWLPGEQDPSKHELEHMHKDDELNEETIANMFLSEDAKKQKEAKAKPQAQHVNPDGSLSINAGGVATELATLHHLISWKHKHQGTFGSKEHEDELKPVKDELNNLTKGADPKHVQLRIDHGKVAARGIVRDMRRVHGSDAKIVNVGHTSKPGDISRFTRGVHNDTQENTSDVALEISGSTKKPHKNNSDGTHFQGYSLKSSKQKQEITAKNPGGNMDGMLDHPSRKLQAQEVGSEGLRKHVHEPMGLGGMSRSQRAAALDKAREEHAAAGGAKNKSAFELKANEGGKKAIKGQVDELHDHLHHLTSLPNGEGHKMIGKMLNKHLVPDTDMPNKKVKVSGDIGKRVSASVEENSDHPIKKLLNDPKTQFSVQKNAGGGALNVGFKHPETGEHVNLATYAPKPKSNASKENVMGWNVKAAKFH